MSQRTDDYIGAMVTCEAAEAEVEELVERLRKYAKPLIDDWRRCRDLVTEKTPLMRVKEKLFGKSVPTPEEIQTAMIRFFESEEAVREAWSRLSADEQRHLVSPEESPTQCEFVTNTAAN